MHAYNLGALRDEDRSLMLAWASLGYIYIGCFQKEKQKETHTQHRT